MAMAMAVLGQSLPFPAPLSAAHVTVEEAVLVVAAEPARATCRSVAWRHAAGCPSQCHRRRSRKVWWWWRVWLRRAYKRGGVVWRARRVEVA